MAEAIERRTPSRPKSKAEFSIYQNPAFSAVLTAQSLQPPRSTVAVIIALSFASGAVLLSVIFREDRPLDKLQALSLSDGAARRIGKIIKILIALVFASSFSALIKICLLKSYRNAYEITQDPSIDRQSKLSQRQLSLLGMKQKSPEKSLNKPTKTPETPVPLLRTLNWSYTPTRPSQTEAGPWGKPSSPQTVPSSATPPRLKPSSISGKGIASKEMLEQFLADVQKKIPDSASAIQQATPPQVTSSFGIVSPASKATPGSTPLRAPRMSPGSHQKFSTPPKKGEGELPSPMSMEQTQEALESLGIDSFIEQWRDNLRQWFSSVLLNPLVEKIDSSHTQGQREWQPTFTQDEDGLLHQLRAFLFQTRDACRNNPQLLQQTSLTSGIQGCLDAITEHQRLHALMKGDLVKGLLPQSSIRADYTVRRIRELAEGTCVKNYEFNVGEAFDKASRKWAPELPTDSHLLSYLFCAFLDQPKWMLHIEPASYSGTQSSKNPLFLGVLPPKDRFPEKYVAIVSTVPEVIHPGACVLVIGKQNPPIFALYWDKKLQLALQGRTALWDAIVLLCHRIQLTYGGIIRGVHLGSSAFGILPILEADCED
ncbi:cytochrome B561, amino-terminal protein isoform X2 [Wolffia australiana]